MRCRYWVHVVLVLLSFVALTSVADASSGALVRNSSVGASASSPAAPSPAFKYSPSAPTTGHSVSFDASTSTCLATPCTYSWADDPPSGGSWPLGSGQTMTFPFQDVGTKYVTLTVTDALKRSATVEHSVAVSAAAPTATAA